MVLEVPQDDGTLREGEDLFEKSVVLAAKAGNFLG